MLSSFMLRPTSLAVFMTKESKHCASSMLSERRAMSTAKSVSVIYVAGNLRLNLCVIVRPTKHANTNLSNNRSFVFG